MSKIHEISLSAQIFLQWNKIFCDKRPKPRLNLTDDVCNLSDHPLSGFSLAMNDGLAYLKYELKGRAPSESNQVN